MRPARVLAVASSFPLLLIVACQSPEPGSDGGAGAGAYTAFARMPPNAQYLKPGDSRTFAIEYTAQVKDIPAGSKLLRIWVPIPQDRRCRRSRR